jgi:hypothetical protein
VPAPAGSASLPAHFRMRHYIRCAHHKYSQQKNIIISICNCNPSLLIKEKKLEVAANSSKKLHLFFEAIVVQLFILKETPVLGHLKLKGHMKEPLPSTPFT